MRTAFLEAEGGPVSRATSLSLLTSEASLSRSLFQVIGSARRRLDVRFYRVQGDAAGHRFADALVERARAGVRVRVLLDDFGMLGMGRIDEVLVEGGVELERFNPVLTRDVSVVGMRDHAKLVVADGTRAWVASANIGDGYAADWHDCGVQVAGPVVRWLAEEFALVWQAAALHTLPSRDNVTHRPSPSLGPTWCRVVSNGFRGWDVRPHVQAMLEAAQRVVHVHHCYLTDPDVLERLRHRAEQGVQVLIIAPHASDVPAVDLVMRRDAEGLASAGVRYLHWPAMSHRKYLSVDHRWMLFGSPNLDALSLDQNLEVGLAVFSRRLGRQASALLMARDLARSHPVVGDELSAPARLASRVVGLFRSVL